MSGRLRTHVLIAFKKEFPQDQLEEDEMEALRDIDAAYEQWEREVKADTARSFVLTVCQQLGIELTEQQLTEMSTWDEDQLKQAMTQIIATRRWPGS